MADKAPTLIDELDDPPPWLCRLSCVEPNATQRGLPVRPVPLPKLVKRSRLTRRTFQRISWLSTFNGIPVDVVSKFFTACGLDPDHERRRRQVMEFMARHGDYVFKLGPKKLRKKKLRALDAKYQRWCEARSNV